MVVVTAILGLVAALAAGLSMGASTVVLLTRNQASAVHARATADAGMAHALAVVLAVLPRWRHEGLASPAAAVADLVSHGRLWDAAVSAGFPHAETPSHQGSYLAAIGDDDAPSRGLVAVDIAAVGEDGAPAHDANGRLVVRAEARVAPAAAVVEATVGVVPLPAVLLRGATRVGEASLGGHEGRLHVIGDLEVSGPLSATGPIEATGHLAASARPATSARVSGGVRGLPIPDFALAGRPAWAGLVLLASGVVGNAAGEPLCRPGDAECPPASSGWQFIGGRWTLTAAPPAPSAVFVEGDAVLAPVADPAVPVVLSVAASGSVLAAGRFTLRPAVADVLIAAGGDVRIEGGLVADLAEALVVAGEQLAVRGPARLRGALLALGRGQASALVAVNELSGGVTVAAEGALASSGYATWRVQGWRRDQAW